VEKEEEEEWDRRRRDWAFAYATHDKSVSVHVRETLRVSSLLYL
jgi:hypothetical protein